MALVTTDDGTEIHYDTVGDGPPVVFIHGLGSSTRDWERQVPTLSESHRVITVDLRGHGESEQPPGHYSIERFARDVAAVVEHLEVSPVTLVGISLGGMVALQLAADRPELVAALVVVNALPDNELLRDARLQIALRKIIVRFLGMERMGKVLAGRLFPDPDMSEERELMAERWAENDASAYRRSFQAAIDWPGVIGRLDGLDAPMLMISSAQDYVSLEQKQPYLDAMPAMEHVVIEDAHHAVPMERPEQFNEVLEAFLDRVGA